MTETPLWFGPSGRQLFGWVHRPDAADVRAAVVLCPSMGQEASFAHFTFRDIALRLAGRGFVVVRFDYDGTGDSVGSYRDAGRVRSWLSSIDEAIALAHQQTAAPVVLVGLRLGALLAAETTQRRPDVHGLVLWDSPRSGRSYVKEQRARHNLSVGEAEADLPVFSALGLTFTQETLDDLFTIDLRTMTSLLCEVGLSVDRPGIHPAARGGATRTGRPLDRLEATDQDDFLYREAPPDETVSALVAWLSETYPLGSASPLTDAGGETRTPSLNLSTGVESVVELGPDRLFGISYEPESRRSTTTVVFVPERFTPHVGLSRTWTDLARSWGEDGIRTLRFDLSGLGDSDPRSGLPGHQSQIVEHIDDVVNAVRAISPDDPSDVLLIGLCSGAYLGLEAATVVGPRGVAVINPVLSFITQESPVDSRRRAIQLTRPVLSRPLGRMAGRVARRLAKPEYAPTLTQDPSFEWDRSLEASFWRNYLLRVVPRLPELAWALLNRILLTRRTEELFTDLTTGGTHVLLIAGDPDWAKFTTGSRRPLARLARDGALELVRVPGLDHALMRPVERDAVLGSLTRFVGRRLIGSATTSQGFRPTTAPAAPADGQTMQGRSA